MSRARSGPFIFPCGHSRDLFDCVDSDFDVICPKCFGHFFRYAFLPYLAFVALFTTIYFWRPLALVDMLFAIFSLFVISYTSAVLRHRPGRLFLVLVILSPISLLVASHLRQEDLGRTTLKPIPTWCFLALIIVLVVSLVRGVVNAAALKGVHRASPLVFFLLVAGLTATAVHIALNLAVVLFPTLKFYSALGHIIDIVDGVQHYRVILILLAGGIALIWSGALSVTAAREEEGEKKLDHSALGELRRILQFIGTVLVHLGTELAMVFKDSLRHFWLMSANAFRSIVIIVVAWGLALSIYYLSMVTSVIWDSGAFLLPTRFTLALLALYVLLTWLGTWMIIIVAFVRRQPKVSSETAGDNVAQACLVFRFGLLRSTPIYWFYPSVVLFISWFIIGALRFAYGLGAGLPVGIVFSIYALVIFVLGIGNRMMQRRQKKRVSNASAKNE